LSALGPITILLGVGAVAATTVSHIGAKGRDDHDDALVGWGLIWVWCFGVAARILTPAFFPDAAALLYLYSGPLIDLMFGWFVCVIYFRKAPRPAWKSVLLLLVAVQVLAHLVFGLAPPTHAAVYAYKATLNLTYVGQLLCSAAPGAAHALRRLFPNPGADRQESAG
jgi:peptidoglycan/LPS O-acetylase OafA/YrhL